MRIDLIRRCPFCWDHDFARQPLHAINVWVLLIFCRPVRCRRCGRETIRPLWCR